MNLLAAATLLVADPDATVARYAEWLDHTVIERGDIDAGLAASWGAPASAGKRYVLSRPAAGAGPFIRFVAGDIAPGIQPLRTFGWAALELCVHDVLAANERMARSPFEIIGPPRLLDTMPEIYPMQVCGPDGEIIYLTEIRANPSGVVLPRARGPVDQLFILVLGCADVTATFDWFADTLAVTAGVDVEITYTMLARAYDLPLARKHRIITGLHERNCFLEFDQYPEAAAPRPVAPGQLPPGIAMATFYVADFSNVKGAWVASPTLHRSALYAGARSGVLRGPDGVLIELIEAR